MILIINEERKIMTNVGLNENSNNTSLLLDSIGLVLTPKNIPEVLEKFTKLLKIEIYSQAGMRNYKRSIEDRKINDDKIFDSKILQYIKSNTTKAKLTKYHMQEIQLLIFKKEYKVLNPKLKELLKSIPKKYNINNNEIEILRNFFHIRQYEELIFRTQMYLDAEKEKGQNTSKNIMEHLGKLNENFGKLGTLFNSKPLFPVKYTGFKAAGIIILMSLLNQISVNTKNPLYNGYEINGVVPSLKFANRFKIVPSDNEIKMINAIDAYLKANPSFNTKDYVNYLDVIAYFETRLVNVYWNYDGNGFSIGAFQFHSEWHIKAFFKHMKKNAPEYYAQFQNEIGIDEVVIDEVLKENEKIKDLFNHLCQTDTMFYKLLGDYVNLMHEESMASILNDYGLDIPALPPALCGFFMTAFGNSSERAMAAFVYMIERLAKDEKAIGRTLNINTISHDEILTRYESAILYINNKKSLGYLNKNYTLTAAYARDKLNLPPFPPQEEIYEIMNVNAEKMAIELVTGLPEFTILPEARIGAIANIADIIMRNQCFDSEEVEFSLLVSKNFEGINLNATYEYRMTEYIFKLLGENSTNPFAQNYILFGNQNFKSPQVISEMQVKR